MLPRTLADHVAAELHAAILSGEITAGSALRINDLAAKFGTSPMPVRDALRQLEGRGIVEIAPHKGARVLGLSLADLEDTFATRAAVESLAVGLAAPRITDADLAAAREALDRHVAALEEGHLELARLAHHDFHFALYRAAGSEWLLRAIEPAWRNAERYLFAAPKGDVDHAATLREHEELLDTCARGDADMAAAATRRHIESAGCRIATLLARAVEAGA